MEKKWKRMADAVALIHVGWVIITQVLGSAGLFIGFIMLNVPEMFELSCVRKALIFSQLGWVVTGIAKLTWGGCPLTLLENSLRRRSYSSGKPMRSFIADLLERRFSITVQPELVAAAGLTTLALSAATLVCVW